VPRGKWGAWEVVGRYSHIDVADRKIDGGVFNRETVGLAWCDAALEAQRGLRLHRPQSHWDQRRYESGPHETAMDVLTSRIVASYRGPHQRCVEQLDQIAVSDRETFEGLTQFLTQ